ncbi:phosphocarrier protein [Dethiosulfatibacter aminovorans DSM 17477]|uniref:Phosphocarrier protein HPr n=1 Tax=Dethiosulfatibacter aminovorans DSM 17477 TaxID=1121476 RepID=A0A1M6FY91_9FIRM|nr:HPr family phosphocarrier protein [Dethiosulfatibacter aminovorans]SHJ02705.1 phosphocarrier protein [Dethiosulfatibacter aminovorans DSM 17477]
MTSKKYVIKNTIGLHARPAALFVKKAAEFESKIKVVKDDKEADAKSIISIMALGAVKGAEIVINANGDDSESAVEALVELLDSFAE